MCSEEIKIRAHIMLTILGSRVNKIGGTSMTN